MMTQTAPNQRRYTVAEYMALDGDARYELIEGALILVPAPNRFHQEIITALGTFIDVHVRANSLGKCYHTPFDVRGWKSSSSDRQQQHSRSN